jgi:hypothetical protein
VGPGVDTLQGRTRDTGGYQMCVWPFMAETDAAALSQGKHRQAA